MTNFAMVDVLSSVQKRCGVQDVAIGFTNRKKRYSLQGRQLVYLYYLHQRQYKTQRFRVFAFPWSFYFNGKAECDKIGTLIWHSCGQI